MTVPNRIFPTCPDLRVRKLLFVVLLFWTWMCLAGFPVHANAPRTVRVAVFQNAPMVFMDEKGVAQGLFIDVLRAVAKEEKWELEFVPGTWDDGLDGLRKSTVDIVNCIVYTPERDAYADYSREVVWTVWGMTFVSPDSHIESVPSMQGKRVGVMKGSVHGDNFQKLCAEFRITCEIVPLPTCNDVLKAVETGEVDAGAINSVFGMMHAHRYRVKQTSIVFSPSNTFYAVPEGKDADILATIDTHLREWKRERGSPYHRSINRWFKHAGPGTPVVPRWLVVTVCALALGAALLFFWVWLLRRVVEARTAALRESEERFALAMEASRDGLWDWDTATNHVYYSPGYMAMLGYGPRDLPPHLDSWSKLVHPEDREPTLEASQQCIVGNCEGFSAEFRMRSRNGEWRWILGRGRAVAHDESGHATRMIGTHTDITARKREEEMREKLEAQLRQSQKMEAVGQLAGGIAHDFNNLLQAILGYGEIALDEIDDNPDARGAIEQIRKASERAKNLVSQLLAFSRRQVLDMQEIDLNEQVNDLMKMIRRVIGEHIHLNVVPDRDLGAVRADPGQIEQILMNLCVNARDAMPEGGTITIETENVHVDEEYADDHPSAQPGRYVLLSVTDTGCGMDREMQEYIFEPFFTTKEVGKGTGLGLSTVYGLVQQHNGFTRVYSEVGKGTTIKIYLPRVEKRRAPKPGPKVEGAPSGGKETILLAEDEATVRRLTCTILERAGYTVLPAEDGREAIDIFNQHADEIDLALLDVIMPEQGGKAVYEYIRGKRPDTRVIFMSGYSMNAIHTNFVLDEGLDLIQKPAARQTLLHKVREVLDRE